MGVSLSPLHRKAGTGRREGGFEGGTGGAGTERTLALPVRVGMPVTARGPPCGGAAHSLRPARPAPQPMPPCPATPGGSGTAGGPCCCRPACPASRRGRRRCRRLGLVVLMRHELLRQELLLRRRHGRRARGHASCPGAAAHRPQLHAGREAQGHGPSRRRRPRPLLPARPRGICPGRAGAGAGAGGTGGGPWTAAAARPRRRRACSCICAAICCCSRLTAWARGQVGVPLLLNGVPHVAAQRLSVGQLVGGQDVVQLLQRDLRRLVQRARRPPPRPPRPARRRRGPARRREPRPCIGGAPPGGAGDRLPDSWGAGLGAGDPGWGFDAPAPPAPAAAPASPAFAAAA